MESLGNLSKAENNNAELNEELEKSRLKLTNNIKKRIYEINSDSNYYIIEAVVFLEFQIKNLKNLDEDVSKYEKLLPKLRKKVLTNNIKKNNSDPNFKSIGTVKILEKIIKKFKDLGEDVSEYKKWIADLKITALTNNIIKDINEIKSDSNYYIIDDVDTLELYIEELGTLWVDTSEYEEWIAGLRKKVEENSDLDKYIDKMLKDE